MPLAAVIVRAGIMAKAHEFKERGFGGTWPEHDTHGGAVLRREEENSFDLNH